MGIGFFGMADYFIINFFRKIKHFSIQLKDEVKRKICSS